MTFTYSHASSRKKSIYSHPSMCKHIQVYMFLFIYHFKPLWFHYIEFTLYLLHIYLLNDLSTLRQLMMEAWQLPKRDFLAMETRSLPKRVLSALENAQSLDHGLKCYLSFNSCIICLLIHVLIYRPTNYLSSYVSLPHLIKCLLQVHRVPSLSTAPYRSPPIPVPLLLIPAYRFLSLPAALYPSPPLHITPYLSQSLPPLSITLHCVL